MLEMFKFLLLPLLLVACTSGEDRSSDTGDGDSVTDSAPVHTGGSDSDPTPVDTHESGDTSRVDSGDTGTSLETGGGETGGGEDSASEVRDVASADAVVLGEEPDDLFGRKLVGAGDMNGDGKMDIWVVTQDRDPPIAYLFEGPMLGETPASAAALRVTDGTEVHLVRATAPACLTSAGDVDGDGLSDVWFGVYGDGETHDDGGAALLLAPATGEVYLEDADAFFWGEELGSDMGYSLAGPGDVNGDGWDDLLIGDPDVNVSGAVSDEGGCPKSEDEEGGFDDGEDAGMAFLVLGPISGEHTSSEAEASLAGEDGYDSAGDLAAKVGDLDGDGLADLFVGASNQCEGGVGTGAAYIVLGPVSRTSSLVDADGKVMGDDLDDGDSMTLAGARDVDGDGTPDLLLGMPRAHSGTTYLILGPALGKSSVADAESSFSTEASGGWSGASVSSAGDLDADGFDDFIVGDPQEDTGGHSAGAAYIIRGPVSGAHDLSEADLKLIGAERDYLGWTTAGLGDTDGDGLPDLAISAIGSDLSGEDAGAAYLLLGGGSILSSLGGS